MLNLSNMTIEELKQLLKAVEAELAKRTETDKKLRIYIDEMWLGDGRKGTMRPHARLVKSVNLNLTNGYALEGEFLPINREVDLPIGSVVVIVGANGSWKHPHSVLSVYVVYPTKESEHDKPNLKYIAAFSARAEFLSARDFIHKLLGEIRTEGVEAVIQKYEQERK